MSAIECYRSDSGGIDKLPQVELFLFFPFCKYSGQ